MSAASAAMAMAPGHSAASLASPSSSVPLPCSAESALRGLVPLPENLISPPIVPLARGLPATRPGQSVPPVRLTLPLTSTPAGALSMRSAGAAAPAEARALDLLHVDLAAFERDVDAGLAEADAVGERKALAVEADVALEAVEDGGVERLVRPRALPARDRRLGGAGHRQPLVEQGAQQLGNRKLVDVEARLDAAPVACRRKRDLAFHVAAGDA